jgi:hypothetical protein
MSPRWPKEQDRDQNNVLAYLPATTVTKPTPTKGTEARPNKRPRQWTLHHSDWPHADQRNVRHHNDTLANQPATTVAETTPTKGTEASSDQRTSVLAGHHNDWPHAEKRKTGETWTTPLPIGPKTHWLSPRRPKEQRRNQINALTYRPATTAAETTPTKGTGARPEQRPCLSARHHINWAHAEERNIGETWSTPSLSASQHIDWAHADQKNRGENRPTPVTMGPPPQWLTPRRPKDRTRHQIYRPDTTVTDSTTKNGTEARLDQRPCLSAGHHSDWGLADQRKRGVNWPTSFPWARHHSDWAHANQRNRGETRITPLPIVPT